MLVALGERCTGPVARVSGARALVLPRARRARNCRARGPRGSRSAGRGGGGRGTGRAAGPPRFAPPRRAEVIARLDRAALLPAITFIFSRAGCDAAVRQCLAAGLRLTTPEEATEIAAIVAQRTGDIPSQDLPVLGYDDWLAGLVRGIAAHHAGLLPAFKEVVEELFAAGLIRAPGEAARRTTKGAHGWGVGKGAANTGASVDTDPSIRPARPGWTSCSSRSLRRASSAARTRRTTRACKSWRRR